MSNLGDFLSELTDESLDRKDRGPCMIEIGRRLKKGEQK